MIRLSVFFLIAFLSAPSLGCSVPRMGPEYDALISVRKIGTNEFKLEAAKQAGELDYGVRIIAAYYPEGLEFRSPVYYKEIDAWQKGGVRYEASFDLVRIKGYVPYVQVQWYPERIGLCGAYGNSGDLNVE